MSKSAFDDLLTRIPEIARAVNQFKSDAVQQKAYDSLLKSLGLSPGETEPSSEDGGSGKPGKKKRAPKGNSGSSTKAKTKKGQSTPKMVKDLNLRPKGKSSLKQFIDEKKPGSNEERFPVIIYYLRETIRCSPITADHMGPLKIGEV